MAGGQYACLNSGSCLNNNGIGFCNCPSGFTGTYCGSAQGCAAGGSFACLNNGFCNTATGACQCQTGYSGSTCATC